MNFVQFITLGIALLALGIALTVQDRVDHLPAYQQCSRGVVVMTPSGIATTVCAP
jgi:hypothetical protein